MGSQSVSAHARRPERTFRVGLVGPGRTRNGLGPFLARHLAKVGGRVVAVAGRDAARTGAAAAVLANDLGHAVSAHADVDELVRRGHLEALVIASPMAAHLAALRCALAARLPTLCEKPLVDAGDSASAQQVVEGFVAARVPLLENCQWPFALASLRRAGVVTHRRPRRFSMRLSPTGIGRDMLTESLSHPLSLLQAMLPFDGDVAVERVQFERTLDAHAFAGAFRLIGNDFTCDVDIELVHCPQQPRPAWFTVDDARFTRELEMPQYHWSFRHAQGTHSVGDPQADLVYCFALLVTEAELDLARSQAAAIETRVRLFAQIVAAYDA